MNQISSLGIVLVSVFSILISCADTQDFDQFDDIGATPTYEASLLYIEAPESRINNATDRQVLSRNFNFDAFSAEIFADRVLDGSITYVGENTTEKDIQFRIEFLNDEGGLLTTDLFLVPALSSSATTVAYGNGGKDINIIKSTSSLRITVTDQGENQPSNSALLEPAIVLKSSGKFRVSLR